MSSPRSSASSLFSRFQARRLSHGSDAADSAKPKVRQKYRVSSILSKREKREEPNCNNGGPLPDMGRVTPKGWWPKAEQRSSLPAQIVDNLQLLVKVEDSGNGEMVEKYPKGEMRTQLQREVNLYWNCLSDKEKFDVLENIGKWQLMQGKISPPMTDAEAKEIGLPKALGGMLDDERRRALQKLTQEQKEKLRNHLMHGPAISWLRGMLAHRRAAEWNTFSRYFKVKDKEDKEAKANLEAVLRSKPDRTFAGINHNYKFTLKYCHPDGSLGKFPGDPSKIRVGVGGYGQTGMLVADALTRMGVTVRVIEAKPDIGGRFAQQHFYEEDGSEAPDFGEKGIMRIPETSAALIYYLKENAGLQPKQVEGLTGFPFFPNPGTEHTKILITGENPITWRKEDPMPDAQLAQKVMKDFKEFADQLLKPLQEARRTHNYDEKDKLWESYRKDYTGKSFRTVVMEHCREKHGWGETEIKAFGAIGIGTGPFFTLFGISFVEILELMDNQLEKNQHLLTMGTTNALKKVHEKKITRPDGTKKSLMEGGNVRLDTEVTKISRNENGKAIWELKPTNGSESDKKMGDEELDAVVVTTTFAAMRCITGMTSGDLVVPPDIAQAISNQHMVSSTKVIILTDEQFWRKENDKNPDEPRPIYIMTDHGPCSLICVGYPNSTRGIVYVGYNWGDESDNVQGWNEEKCLENFKEVIRKADPDTAEKLMPLHGEKNIIKVDWQMDEHFGGGFALNRPGQETDHLKLRGYHLRFIGQPEDRKEAPVLVAGDGVINGGWGESAIISGIDAVHALIDKFGGTPVDKGVLESREYVLGKGKNNARK